MKIVRHLHTYCHSLHHPLVSLGNFDGVHLGHQAILKHLVEQARLSSGEAVVLTFFPHPLTVLYPEKAPPAITSLREKLLLFADLGIDTVVLQRFTPSFSRLSAEDFVRCYLVELLEARKVVVGPNVGFGHGRAGSVQTLKALAPQYGFTVEVIGPVKVGEVEVSSSRVRSLLASAKIQEASSLLGRPYLVEGRVEVGHRRGQRLGFPTANVRPAVDLLIPDGVYAVLAQLGRKGSRLKGVANIGTNPTFGGSRRTLEVHLLDFAADLYGQRMRVYFIEHLRGEVRFPSPEALVQQIEKDVGRAREILARIDTAV